MPADPVDEALLRAGEDLLDDHERVLDEATERSRLILFEQYGPDHPSSMAETEAALPAALARYRCFVGTDTTDEREAERVCWALMTLHRAAREQERKRASHAH